ncbi:O-antigen ligase family protein [Actinoplanes sichuanensis]|uniref:O-antigen ligase family protein n=1 Tax=Actinoplanes sichuanensis TaxID=512349 RepID=A0ABW4AUD9_9ACTN|nr:O-antigen ligase family protein [Actinoplanes sichuanensis]BEL08495.1 O-antigen ligase family protein [Actinoplanes sichuanensis]
MSQSTMPAEHPVDFEPSLVAPNLYSSRRASLRVDVAAICSVVIVLLYCIPAPLIVPQMTFAGRPALLLSLGLFAWWFIARLSPSLLLVGRQPLRWVALLYLMSILLAYVAGLVRGLPTLESNRQDFTLLMTFEFLGLMLMVADGIPNWRRLRMVLKILVCSAAFMAFLGILQSIFAYDVTQWLVVPGLELKGTLTDFQARGEGGRFRVASTTVHSIEFSAVLAMVMPYAIHFARYARSKAGRRFYGLLTFVIAGAVPMAISRTGILALGISMAIMFALAWNWRFRYNFLILAAGLTGVLVVGRPGLLGTLTSMFLWADADPSVDGRTEDYAHVSAWFAQRPWLGRGPGTLIPDLYMILDNQWLLTLVTGGIVGVVALAALHLTSLWLAVVGFRRSTSEEDRHLCAALISTQILAILVALTFDSLGFTTFSFTLALLSGMCGAVWRLTHPARTVRTSTVRRFLE